MTATTDTQPLTEDQAAILDLVLTGQMAMSYAIAWAIRTGQPTFAEFLKEC